MSDGVHEMRLAESYAAVHEEGVVDPARRFGDGERRRMGEAVGIARDEGVEGVVRVQGRGVSGSNHARRFIGAADVFFFGRCILRRNENFFRILDFLRGRICACFRQKRFLNRRRSGRRFDVEVFDFDLEFFLCNIEHGVFQKRDVTFYNPFPGERCRCAEHEGGVGKRKRLYGAQPVVESKFRQ